MNNKKVGFGTRTGFALAAAGSAIGLGNLWGLPYKVSANGGSAYLFVYFLCIVLIGAVAMMAEFAIGRNAKANTVSAFQKVSPGLGWAGLLAVVIPFIIICYYFVLGGFTVKFALNSYAGNEDNFYNFAGNHGDVLLHTLLFALLAFAIVAAGIRGGIEKSAKILMPTVLFFLLLIVCISLMLGEGVGDGIAYYLRPDFSALTPSAVLSAMGQALFSLSLGCGAMITYGSYAVEKFSIGKAALAVCSIDVVISLLMGFAIFPALFHYSAVSGVPVSEMGFGNFGLMFVTMSRVFAEIPMIGQTISFLFFTIAAIVAVTSVISILEVVTQFLIQKYRVYRTKAAMAVSLLCFVLSIPIVYSLGAALTGRGGVTIFGKNLFEYLDATSVTLLMPICALLSCLAASKLLKREGIVTRGYYPLMVKYVTPLLIIAVELIGIVDLIMPNRRFSKEGLGIVLVAYGVIALCVVVYFAFLKKDTGGCNQDEVAVRNREVDKIRQGLPLTWTRMESEGEDEER